MSKKIRETIDSWDLKSFFLTIGLLLIGLFLYLFFNNIRDRSRGEIAEELKGFTKGTLISVEKNDRITQGRYGTNISIDSYKVYYWYVVGRRRFQSIDVIPFTANNKNLVRAVLRYRIDSICNVRFDKNEPKRSLLVERE